LLIGQDDWLHLNGVKGIGTLCYHIFLGRQTV
jgi:hypothetical protein